MKARVDTGDVFEQPNAIIIGVFEDYVDTATDAALGGVISALRASREFSGEKDSVRVVPFFGKIAPRAAILVGLGKRDSFNSYGVKRATAWGVRVARDAGYARVVVHGALGAPIDSISSQSVALGAELGLYKYDSRKTLDLDKRKEISEVTMLVPQDSLNEARKGFANGLALAAGVRTARELINGPPSEFTPKKLADEAVRIAKEHKIKVIVWDEKELQRRGMGGILAVGSGSMEPPRFVVLDNNGSGAPIVLVGKGITFDSGGLDIKPWNGMDKMQCDMSGAAIVMGVMDALMRLGVKRRVVCLFAAAENMPGNKAYKQGDIITAYNKRTMEIRHTDAEGRVVLADALSYASTLKPSVIIDAATLTGACVVALGQTHAGVFSEDTELCNALISAGDFCGERLWRMPLLEEHKAMVRADTADVRNQAKTAEASESGASTAAAFLSYFAEGRWAHLDIAGVAYTTGHPVLKDPFTSYGATGWGVQLFVEFVKNWKN